MLEIATRKPSFADSKGVVVLLVSPSIAMGEEVIRR